MYTHIHTATNPPRPTALPLDGEVAGGQGRCEVTMEATDCVDGDEDLHKSLR